ncbi:MAG: hypothetical protein OHK0046_18920 [Anaerolineae bacterium]
MDHVVDAPPEKHHLLITVSDHEDLQRLVDLLRTAPKDFTIQTDTIPDHIAELWLSDERPYPLKQTDYQQIVDNQTELICCYDTDFRLHYVNRAYSEWRGTPAEALIGTRFIDHIPEADQPRAMAHVRALTIDNSVAVSIHPSVMANGEQHMIEWTDRALFDANGHLMGYQGVGRDVTARETQAQQLRIIKDELEQSRNHMRAVLDSMQDAIISVSMPDRHLIFASSSFEDIFGYPLEAFINDANFYHKVVHPDDLELATNAMHTCRREGFVEFEHRIVRPDGQVRCIHRRVWMSYDAAGQPV